jgi:CHAD domain-containing protein
MPATVPAYKLLKIHVDAFVRAVQHVDEGDVGALHRTRVASRRLREVIPLLPIGGDLARKLSRRLRRITARLGKVRELDVLLLLIEELHQLRDAHSDALARVAVSVSTDRDRARRARRISSDDLRRATRKLQTLVDDLRGRPPLDTKPTQWAVDARVAHRASRFGDAMREAGAVYLPERLHAVRIALKKFRYSVELADRSGARSAGEALRLLRRTQDVLGRMHDRQVLIDRVRHVQATLTPPSIAMWRSLDALVAFLDDDCRRLHARYMRLRPQLDAVVKGLRPPSDLRSRTSHAGTRAG